MSIVIGGDPDSSKHGIAVYKNGCLVELDVMELSLIMHKFLFVTKYDDALWAVEDVNNNKFVYGRNTHNSKAAQSKIAMGVGKCQQAQVELIRMLDAYSMNYKLIKPQRGNWAKNKAQFEKVTGWTGRSNEDTRSAAWQGYLALKS